MSDQQTIQPVKNWLETIVIGLNLCPFAQREFIQNTIHYCVSEANTETALLTDLHIELNRLIAQPKIETTLLIHSKVLTNFDDYNQFLNLADNLLETLDLSEQFQIASFHPDYQFAGTEFDDAENYSNRAPYPILHLLRQASLSHAIEHHPDVNQIPLDNIKRLNALGTEHMKQLLVQTST
ncbi:MAG: DUF1415 domain-containing protein [Arenicellales bacterium]